MIVLGIETSCDETAAAVLEQNGGRIHILSNIVSSSASLQEKYGGVLPEQAAREQLKVIIPVIEQAINDSRLTINDLDAIAVTFGPGLIGSLLVGVETAKTLAQVWGKPLIPVNHLLGHFYANWLDQNQESKPLILNSNSLILPKFPCIGLLVSGGHTDLIYFKGHYDYEYLGGTRDDAAGECFDKCARLLGLSYPGGPQISKLAEKGNPKAFKLPRPMINSKDFNFSFSGLKTAFANIVKDCHVPFDFAQGPRNDVIPNDSEESSTLSDLAASLEQAIVDVLVVKIVRAVKKYAVKQVIIAGGVAANQKLINDLRLTIKDLKIQLHVPPPQLCTDNAAMIAARAFFDSPIKNPLDLQANPSLSLEL